MQQQPLATLLTAPATTREQPRQAETFAIDPAKAAKGREYFASLGCASCHTLKIDGSPIAADETAEPLAATRSPRRLPG